MEIFDFRFRSIYLFICIYSRKILHKRVKNAFHVVEASGFSSLKNDGQKTIDVTQVLRNTLEMYFLRP